MHNNNNNNNNTKNVKGIRNLFLRAVNERLEGGGK
jgi:hypothetical protein